MLQLVPAGLSRCSCGKLKIRPCFLISMKWFHWNLKILNYLIVNHCIHHLHRRLRKWLSTFYCSFSFAGTIRNFELFRSVIIALFTFYMDSIHRAYRIYNCLCLEIRNWISISVFVTSLLYRLKFAKWVSMPGTSQTSGKILVERNANIYAHTPSPSSQTYPFINSPSHTWLSISFTPHHRLLLLF